MIFRTAYQKKGYPTLVSKKTISFTKTITRKIFEKDITFYSSTPAIIEYEEGYLLHLRWMNYIYNTDGTKKNWPDTIVNLNSRYKLDKEFNPISEELFLQEDYDKIPLWGSLGLEDVRIFKSEEKYYYTATSFDVDREVSIISSGIYNMDTFELPVQHIKPSFYDEKEIRFEKNWAFVLYKNKMAFVYQWYPLQLTEIDYETNQLNPLVTKPMPDYFKEARGSTPGYSKGKEIWFVIHKRRSFYKNKRFCLDYVHCFVIFDIDMNLIRYSEWFRMSNRPIEFCIGLIVTNTEVILSYSILDNQSMVSVYDASSLLRIQWHS